jgi:flagellar assembly protein FliH
MPSPLETIHFPHPLRDVRPAVVADAADVDELQVREREQAAYERGRLEGERALSAQLLKQRGELLEAQNGVLESLRNAVPQVVREAELTVVALALDVAQKLVAGLPISAEMIEAAVREGLAQVEETSEFHIALHPEDLALLQRLESPLLIATAGEKLHFKSSPEVTRGGCIIHTRFGVVDARRETKLELLRKTLEAA